MMTTERIAQCREKYGTVRDGDVEIVLTGQAEPANRPAPDDDLWVAGGIDEDGQQYQVYWRTTEEYELACELYVLESLPDHDKSDEDKRRQAILAADGPYCDPSDGANACDWDNPVKIKRH